MDVIEFGTVIDGYAEPETYTVSDYCDNPIIKQNINGETVSVLHLNIRSINKNFHELTIFLENLGYEVDIIILSETWKVNCIDLFNIDGYNIHYTQGNFNQNDGLLIYTKSNLSIANVDLFKYSENTFINLKICINHLIYNIIAVYRLPSTNKLIFLEELKLIFENNKTRDNNICIFTGDINIDINNKQDQLVNNYLNIMAQNGFLSYINKATRISDESESCIDHFFLRTKNVNENIKITPIIIQSAVTDHYPILIKIEENFKSSSSNKSQIKNTYSQIQYNKLINKLSKENWNNLYNYHDSEIAYEHFINKFTHLVSLSTKTIKLKSNDRRIKPWITKGLLTSLRERDKLKLKLNKNRNDQNILLQYKIYRNKLNNLIKKVRRDYYINKLNENKNNVKKTWNIINEGLNKNKKHNKINIIHQGAIINDIKLTANIFNNFFVNVGKELADEIDTQPLLPNIHKQYKSMFLKPITESEVKNYIHKLKNNSAPGEDRIKSVTLKEVCDLITQPLVYIFNLCLEQGVFPSKLKIAVVTPIYKDGDQNNVSNYRPISVINNIAKLLEMSIKTRLLEHLKYNKILSKYQFGFMENKSTDESMFEVTNSIYKSIENNKKTIAIFLDLRKAFDTVCHKKLLEKLTEYGVRGLANQLFTSYLNNRVQHVKIEDELSDHRKVTFGVPQGTVLGPLLFIAYINDMLNLNSSNNKIIAYADDTVLLVEDENWEAVYSKAATEFAKLNQWLSENVLTINFSKTKFMCFSLYGKNIPNFKKLKIHKYSCLLKNNANCQCKEKLEQTSYTKYLGLYIDSNLKWNIHIENLNTKIRKLTYKFYQLRNIMSKQILRLLYFSLVESLFRYGLIIWGSAYQTTIEQIKISQKYILKIILHKKRQYSTQLLFIESNVFNIDQLYIKSVLLFTYKNKDKLLNLQTHNYSTRSAINLNVNIPIISRSTTQRFITYYSSKFYNLLPANIKLINNLKLFQKKTYLFLKENSQSFINILNFS